MVKKGNVLVVEDNDFVRLQFVRYLDDAGYSVWGCVNGAEAVEYVGSRPGGVDVAVVDVRMEPVDGFEFVRTVRGMKHDFPVIFVTGDDNPDLLERASRCGVEAVMIKPVQRERLCKAVDRIVTIRGKAGG